MKAKLNYIGKKMDEFLQKWIDMPLMLFIVYVLCVLLVGVIIKVIAHRDILWFFLSCAGCIVGRFIGRFARMYVDNKKKDA